MSRLALGLIETVGLAAAIEAADTAVKSANVVLLGYELTKGDGMATVKLAGDVGAVKAAVEAGVIAASKVSKVYSKQIIPRPHSEIEALIYSKETVGLEKEKVKKEVKAESAADVVEEEMAEEEQDSPEEEKKSPNEGIDAVIQEDALIEDEIEDREEVLIPAAAEALEAAGEKESLTTSSRKATCNLCHDPECIRRKGDIRSICLHYNSGKKK
ncbi:Carboxysome shell and ethanolamine utilization microcompartment protein CcmL/EutN [Geosporobacter subterraneus DSM 17957]|uniref:Carboxysome shell and ethanolamine utilization microcompartment protein CcmL/EutN n=1 Tax=Geosporobacter subterraneus DSM 17957 TaxID=1121919 RepID=A0A1M6LPV6_9FIRM|nr:BMC domain-containing protein [Geosporobacter subterraneus]SHJ73238.1 Carboxysome shell and ethanolamine utilization microcompartment protein CcmL/EutN [Geosporobacter subterraneus DSM 17957]